MHPVEEKTEYFPVYYIEPYSDNEKKAGYDLSSGRDFYIAMRTSWLTGKSVVTDGSTLFNDNGLLNNFILLTPVYDKMQQHLSPSGREEGLSGFILGVLNFRRLIEESFRHLELPVMVFHFYDITNGRDSASYIMSINLSDKGKPDERPEKRAAVSR